MAKSRMAAALAAALLFAPAQSRAQSVSPVDPQALIDAQRAELTEGARIGCRRSADPEEIVVCAARENRGIESSMSSRRARYARRGAPPASNWKR